MVKLIVVLLMTFVLVALLWRVIATQGWKLGNKMRKRRAATLFAEQIDPDSILLSDEAGFFGLNSLADSQVLGVGTLILTRTQLWFSMKGSMHPLEISLLDVRKTDIARHHLNHVAHMPLLRVEFVTHFGRDTAAWAVRDAPSWVTAIGDITV